MSLSLPGERKNGKREWEEGLFHTGFQEEGLRGKS